MLTPKKCFLIDDDEDDRELFCTAIQMIDESIVCVFAKDGIDAIRQLEQDSTLIPDYFFIDMNMPLMDGRECLSAILKIDRLKDVPSYLYSTSGSPKLVSEVNDLGAAGFLIKPTSMTELTELLQGIVI